MESLHSGRCMDLKNLIFRTDLAASVSAEEHARFLAAFDDGSQFHFKISSRIYSLRRTFLYSFRPTLALF